MTNDAISYLIAVALAILTVPIWLGVIGATWRLQFRIKRWLTKGSR